LSNSFIFAIIAILIIPNTNPLPPYGMKPKIHPKYFAEATITCACGKVYTTGSTLETMNVEVCANCHPFYTGKQKLVDTARRVDKFQRRAELKTSVAAGKKGRTAKRSALRVKRAEKGPTAEEEGVVTTTQASQ